MRLRKLTVVIVGIWRPVVLGHGILSQICKKDFDGSLQLGVVALSNGLGIQFDLNIWSDSLVLDFPLIVGSPKPPAWSGHDSTIH